MTGTDRSENTRIAMLSLPPSPLAQPGSGDSGGMNVYIRELVGHLAHTGAQVHVYVRRWHPDLPAEVELETGVRPSRTHGDNLASLVKRAQTVILPVVPSPVDIRAALRFFGELKALRNVISTDVKLATVANRVREGTLMANQLEDYLFELTLPNGRKFPFLTMLRASNNYLKAAERGLSIFEFAPVATAIDREYWTPLLRWLASPKSIPGND